MLLKLRLQLRWSHLLFICIPAVQINFISRRVYLLPLDWVFVHGGFTPSAKFAGTHLYTWMSRGTVRVKFLSHDVPDQGSVSRKARENLEDAKSFLVNLSIICIYTHLNLLVWMEPLDTWIKQFCKSWSLGLCSGFRVRKRFGTFKKASPRTRTRTAWSGSKRTKHIM